MIWTLRFFSIPASRGRQWAAGRTAGSSTVTAHKPRTQSREGARAHAAAPVAERPTAREQRCLAVPSECAGPAHLRPLHLRRQRPAREEEKRREPTNGAARASALSSRPGVVKPNWQETTLEPSPALLAPLSRSFRSIAPMENTPPFTRKATCLRRSNAESLSGRSEPGHAMPRRDTPRHVKPSQANLVQSRLFNEEAAVFRTAVAHSIPARR